MSAELTPRPSGKLSWSDQLRYAREIIQIEGHTLLNLAKRINAEFCRAVELIYQCRGSVIVTGMGKAGLIGQKLAATLASTGTRSHYLHPGEAVHGDLGRIHADDTVLVLSQSGETEEIVRLLPSLNSMRVNLIAITSGAGSTLARASTVVIELGPLHEACALGLAPSTSTTAMLAVGDALALVASRMRDFRREDFARFHPAGSLGRQLSRVDDYMRALSECRMARASQSVREVFVQPSPSGRRTGAIMLTDDGGRLAGIFTDSDLARLFESRRDSALDEPISEVMTAQPCTVPQGSMMADAVAIMAERKLSELPVVDASGCPLGMLDITDVVGVFPEISAVASAPPRLSVVGHEAGVVPRPKNPLLFNSAHVPKRP